MAWPEAAQSTGQHTMQEELAMKYSTPGEAGEFLPYPTNQLIGIIADAPYATAMIEALHVAGFAEDQVALLCGPEGARRLDVSGTAHGVLARLYRFIEGLGDMEHPHLTRYEQELLAGHCVIAVEARDHERREQARQIMQTHGGYFMNFYGRWHVEGLAA
jgi:hypothetical protein